MPADCLLGIHDSVLLLFELLASQTCSSCPIAKGSSYHPEDRVDFAGASLETPIAHVSSKLVPG